MSRRTIHFHPEARDELRAAVLSHEREATGLGRYPVQEVRVAIDRLADRPASGGPDGTDLRQIVLGSFPFTVVYQVQGEAFEIVAVIQQSQWPGYWKGRT